MRALYFDGTTLRSIDDQPAPVGGPDDAVVGVRLAGVCSTDLQILAGYMGFTGVPGHEFVGEVIDGPASVVWQQAANRMDAVRALLADLATGGGA